MPTNRPPAPAASPAPVAAPVATEYAEFGAEYGPVTVGLEDVTWIDGAEPTALVVVRYGRDYPDVFEEIWLVDPDDVAGFARGDD